MISYHLDEAIDLASRGEDSVMMGYPQTPHPSQFEELSRLSDKIIHMCDSEHHILKLNNIAASFNTSFNICLDLDMSYYLPMLHFGVMRSSLKETSQLAPHFGTLSRCKNIKLNSINGYEAHKMLVYMMIIKQAFGLIIKYLKKVMAKHT